MQMCKEAFKMETNFQRIFNLSSKHLDAKTQTPKVWFAMLIGAGIGLIWGIAARIWMRLISTNPEFSISGTATILIIATTYGTFAGLTYAARRHGWQGWQHNVPRYLLIFFFLPFSSGAGTPMFLTVLIITLALTNKTMLSFWVLVVPINLVVFATDIGIPIIAAISIIIGAVLLSGWKWFFFHKHNPPKLQSIDRWAEQTGQTILLLNAAMITINLGSKLISEKPELSTWAYIFFYLILLCPLIIALRIGLEPKKLITSPI
jgi:hypothetical protein